MRLIYLINKGGNEMREDIDILLEHISNTHKYGELKEESVAKYDKLIEESLEGIKKCIEIIENR